MLALDLLVCDLLVFEFDFEILFRIHTLFYA
jgi:hypothetical protein